MKVNSNFLQSYVVPVCLYEAKDEKEARVHHLIGTAFFVGERGFFLTAGHVIEQAKATAKAKDQKVGLAIKVGDDQSVGNGLVEIQNIEAAPNPFDIALGQIPFSISSPLRLENFQVESWKDVATHGYPLSTISRPANDLRLGTRCHKGYIQRLTKPEDMHIGLHPNGFELSFNVSPGMSGAPIYIYRGSTDLVIGVAVSSFRGETTESEISEVLEDGTHYKESRLRIEEYGFAHDIRGILDWRPNLGGGRPLVELVN